MDAFLSFHAPGFWLVMALLGAVVAVGVRPFLPQLARTLTLPAYWVLLPYLALISGGVSPRLMGLVYIDWAVSLRIGVGLALAVIALAAVMRAVSMTPSTPSSAAPTQHHTWQPTLLMVALSGAEEFYWSFLRGSVTELLMLLQFSVDTPDYWAIWIAAILAVPTALINVSGTYHQLIKVTILVVTSIVFFYTRNFWLCWILHAAVWLLFLQQAHFDGDARELTTRRASITGKSQSQ